MTSFGRTINLLTILVLVNGCSASALRADLRHLSDTAFHLRPSTLRRNAIAETMEHLSGGQNLTETWHHFRADTLGRGEIFRSLGFFFEPVDGEELGEVWHHLSK